MIRSIRRFGVFSSAILALVSTACGIHYGLAGGGLPANVRTMAVLPFDNQTASPDVQNELLEAMRRGLQRKLGVRDAPEQRADAVVKGVIQSYDADVPIAYSANPQQAVTAQRQLQITIDVEIVEQKTGKVLLTKKGLRAQGEYAERAEPQGRARAIQKLVDDIVEGAQSQW